MPDIVLDTDAMADFLAQYFGPAERGRKSFQESDWLSAQAAREINRIRDQMNATGALHHLVIASCFAFVEIVRKWDELTKQRFEPWQLKAFLQQPPPWF